MNRRDLEDALFEVIEPLLPGVTLIWEDQSAPRPAKPYVSLNFLTPSQRLGFDEQRVDGDQISLVGQRRFVVSVNAFGENRVKNEDALDAADLLEKIVQGLYKEETIASLKERCLASITESEIRDLTALQETRYESRAQVDLTFHRTVSQSEDLPVIEKVELNDQLVEVI